MDKDSGENMAISDIVIKINEINKLCITEQIKPDTNYTEQYVIKITKNILKAYDCLVTYANLLNLKIEIPKKDTGLCFEPDYDLVQGMLQDSHNIYITKYFPFEGDVSKQERLNSLLDLLWSMAKMHDIKLSQDDILIVC